MRSTVSDKQPGASVSKATVGKGTVGEREKEQKAEKPVLESLRGKGGRETAVLSGCTTSRGEIVMDGGVTLPATAATAAAATAAAAVPPTPAADSPLATACGSPEAPITAAAAAAVPVDTAPPPHAQPSPARLHTAEVKPEPAVVNHNGDSSTPSLAVQGGTGTAAGMDVLDQRRQGQEVQGTSETGVGDGSGSAAVVPLTLKFNRVLKPGAMTKGEEVSHNMCVWGVGQCLATAAA